MKEMWIGDMKLDDIKEVTPITKAQAETGMNGKADVEYTFEVTFNTKGEESKVKIKCYPTKCRVQIQHMGGPSRPKECLDGQHSPKFFGDKFMIPWAKNVLKNNPNLDDIVLPFLRAEMHRLEEKIKVSKKGSSKVRSGQATCSARKCGFPNKTVNLSNVGVYGTCGRCAKYEHFRGAKIKDEEKEEIIS